MTSVAALRHKVEVQSWVEARPSMKSASVSFGENNPNMPTPSATCSNLVSRSEISTEVSIA